MKKNEQDNKKMDTPIRAYCYMRVATVAQLSPEERKKYLALHPEEGEKHDADSDS